MKNIMVVSTTRADWGLLKPVVKKIKDSDKLSLILTISGTHLLKEYGYTVEEVINDGFIPSYKVDILKFENSDIGTAKTIAYTIEVFSELLLKSKPDLVLVLGDRFEIFAVATACSALSIPIAHISGGDVTLGAKDDFYRHCITKMSCLHFASCDDSYKRLLRLGEAPNTVFNTGGLGNENIKNLKLKDKKSLSKEIDFDLSKDFALITYHPETQKQTSPKQDMQNLFNALDTQNLNLIFTKSNADEGAKIINEMIDDYCLNNSHKAKSYFSLGALNYLSCMNYAKVVIGNSSSGVIETPVFKKPCVNIGDRQKGRFISENIIQATADFDSIKTALQTALSDEFFLLAQKATNPYDNGLITSSEIVKQLEIFTYSDKTIKIFYDGEK